MKIKIKTPERFKEYEIDSFLFFNNNGYLSLGFSKDIYYSKFDKRYIVFKEVIEDKSKALLNLNHSFYVIQCICRNIIFNDCEFSIEEV